MCEFSLEELMILSNKSERRVPRERERERERVQCECISYTKQARSKQSGRNPWGKLFIN